MNMARDLTPIIVNAVLALSVVPATAAETVSPGALDRLAGVESRCPTFSWGEDDSAAVYDLVAYLLPENTAQEVEFTAETEVLNTSVVGSATSWTPSAEQCFAPGGRYVWFVRSVTAIVDDQVIEAGEWSAGRYFEVPAGPTPDELARALDVLKRWEATNGGGSLALFAGAGSGAVPAAAVVPDADSDADADAGWAAPKSVPTAASAVRGEHPGTSGEVYGVVGTSASADGAGIAAANLDGGPDLVLDGSADGGVDTVIHENVLKRSSPDDEIFLFHNGGGGTLDLHVHGTLNGDGLNVQYGPVIDDDGNWLGVGDTVPCTSCVTSSDIADGTIIDNDLAVDAVTEDKIEHGAVGTTKLQNGSVTSAKIADSSITSADLADGSVSTNAIMDGGVRAADLAVSAVTSEKIADSSITHVDLATGSVTSAKIADSTITSDDLANGSVSANAIIGGSIKTSHLVVNAVTSEKIADFSITNDDLAHGSVGSNTIIDGGIRPVDLGAGAVTSAKIATGAVGATQIADGSISSADIGSSQIGPDHILNMGVNTADLATGAVTTSKIEDGTITAADVDPAGGVYASKTAVYTETATQIMNPGACTTTTAACLDANDLPLQGYWGLAPSIPMKIRDAWADYWDDNTIAAQWTVHICYEPTGTIPQEFSSSIVCLSVPGP